MGGETFDAGLFSVLNSVNRGCFPLQESLFQSSLAQLQLTWTRLVSLPGSTLQDEPLVRGVKMMVMVKMMVITLRLLTSFQEDQGAQEGESASSPTAI